MRPRAHAARTQAVPPTVLGGAEGQSNGHGWTGEGEFTTESVTTARPRCVTWPQQGHDVCSWDGMARLVAAAVRQRSAWNPSRYQLRPGATDSETKRMFCGPGARQAVGRARNSESLHDSDVERLGRGLAAWDSMFSESPYLGRAQRRCSRAL